MGGNPHPTKLSLGGHLGEMQTPELKYLVQVHMETTIKYKYASFHASFYCLFSNNQNIIFRINEINIVLYYIILLVANCPKMGQLDHAL